MGLLNGKTAFITGAASGLGADMARTFAREGARVAVADIDIERGQAVCAQIEEAGGEAIYCDCDVAQPDAVRDAIAHAVRHFGQLDIVCANAGINGVFAPIEELQPHEWKQTLEINLSGTFHTVHFAVPHLKNAGGGSILITSSVNGNRIYAYAGASAYCTSKAAQVTFMKTMALELGRHNIRCNALCPGYVPSNIHERTHNRNTHNLGLAVHLPHGSPAINGGCGQPQDVSNTALFLVSDAGAHISGVEIYVDGGASLVG